MVVDAELYESVLQMPRGFKSNISKQRKAAVSCRHDRQPTAQGDEPITVAEPMIEDADTPSVADAPRTTAKPVA